MYKAAQVHHQAFTFSFPDQRGKQRSTANRFKLIIGRPLVYVIGLHAVQFGNNWMKKIPRTPKIRPRPIWLSEEFFEFNYFQIGQACSPLTY